jgi:hypothetical protein
VRKFKLELGSKCMVFVHATSYAQDGKWLKFFLGDCLVAEVTVVSVRSIEEVPVLLEQDWAGV